MNGPHTERLYNLLPAVYRVRDAAHSEQLRALLRVMESVAQEVEQDIDLLYEDWFIETCRKWVVPYIGDLLGVRGLHGFDSKTMAQGAFSQRSYVGNTLAYRRRKGTAAVLEQLARDLTGWPTRVVEFFELLGTTQHLNHVRPANLRTPDLRETNKLELLNGPFEQAAHTAEVRRIARRRGRYNIPNIGLFQWRLQPYFVSRGSARALDDPPQGRFTFSPLGLDTELFNLPQTETEITHLAEEINVPGRLRRRALYDELQARRRANEAKLSTTGLYFGLDPVLRVFTPDGSGGFAEVPPEEIMICNLSDWDSPGWQPRSSTTFEKPDRATQIVVDPVLGRLARPADKPPVTELQVSYAYGFSSDVGGGPYPRQASLEPWLDPRRPKGTWMIGVTKQQAQQTLGGKLRPAQFAATLSGAVDKWNKLAKPANGILRGLIVLMDSRTYDEDLTGASHRIVIPADSQLAIVAADGCRPHIFGNISVVGDSDGANPGELILDGILIEGSLTVLVGNLGSLRLAHCTLVPGKGKLAVNASVAEQQQNRRLTVRIERSICGSLVIPDSVRELYVADSVIDGSQSGTGPGQAIWGEEPAASAPPGTLVRSTIFGKVKVKELTLASEVIFTDLVEAERRQTGCVRFSYVPEGSKTPRGYRCQPDLEISERVEAARKEAQAQGTRLTQSQNERIAAAVRSWLVPAFTSTRYGRAAYAQLGTACPKQIRTGAEDGSEMGVFSHLKQPQREANLRASLEEYLRFGLEAGVFYET